MDTDDINYEEEEEDYDDTWFDEWEQVDEDGESVIGDYNDTWFDGRELGSTVLLVSSFCQGS